MLAFDNDLESVLDEADARGLLAPPYVWLSADTLTVGTPAAASDPTRVAALLRGFLTITISIAQVRSPAFSFLL